VLKKFYLALGVLILALGTREVPAADGRERPRLRVRGMGRPFALFLAVAALFDLGNSADAFVLLRAQERGLGVPGVLGMLLCFNLVYATLSLPAGRLSDRIGRRPVIAAGWALYAGVYLGLGLAGLNGTPALNGEGTLLPGLPFELVTTNAFPFGTAVYAVGFTRIDLPFLGGTLVPAPELILGLATNSAGEVVLSGTWPAIFPSDTTLVYQYWIVDPAAVFGASASNAVASTTP